MVGHSDLRRLALAILLAFAPLAIARADDESLSRISLDDLLQVEVTTVSKHSQRLVEAASAVYVITSEDIRRSGFNHLADVLRLAPGMQVGRADANTWSVSTRGFSFEQADKLLVMIDGRSQYTSYISGVLWDRADVALEDIERIEIVRGPGATLWGANAVNGVINVITRRAVDSQGTRASLLAGTDAYIAYLRHGGQLGERVRYRLTARGTQRDNAEFLDGDQASDDWNIERFGGRVDWLPSGRDTLTFAGDWHHGSVGQPVRFDAPIGPGSGLPGTFVEFNDAMRLDGGFGSVKWNRTWSETSKTEAHLVLDLRDRDVRLFNERRRKLDGSFEHHWSLGDHDLVYGASYRAELARLDGSPNTTWFHENTRDALYSAFVHDRIELGDQAYVSVGSKLSHNSYTGWELQPSARGFYALAENQQLWAAVSRSVRTPSQINTELGSLILSVIPAAVFPCPGPFGGVGCPVRIIGDPDMKAEVAWSYELGYRIQPTSHIQVDIATFLMDYENLVVSVPVLTAPGTVLSRNRGSVWTYGLEAFASWRVNSWLRLTGNYTGFNMRDRTGLNNPNADPHHRFQVHSYLDLPGHFELDLAGYYVGRREVQLFAPVDPFGSDLRMDLRVAWRPRPNLEVSGVIQNLFDQRDAEFAGTTAVRQYPRAYYLKLDIGF